MKRKYTLTLILTGIVMEIGMMVESISSDVETVLGGVDQTWFVVMVSIGRHHLKLLFEIQHFTYHHMPQILYG